ncbi:MAG: glycosyltransferase [Terriglobia bacterium]|nr:MAG: glycosyltransferase [Terriglobia bacterium]
MPTAVPSSFCVVVPCYNEEEMLPDFFRFVLPQLERATKGLWTLICVDDGSRDRTFDIVIAEHLKDPRVEGVKLSRNFGHQAAVSVGLAFAKGDYIGILDCDLQDPVEVLIGLFDKARSEQLDVCYGIRSKRDAHLLLRMAYSVFYRIIGRVADHPWPRDAGDFSVMSARCHQILLSLPEHSRMLRGLRSWVGFKQAGIPYDRPARLHGASKYSIRKLCALALQGLTAFSTIPLRLASFIGIGMAGFSLLFGIVVLLNRLLPHLTLFGFWIGANPGVTTLACFLAFVFSILFLSIGIIGEYLAVLLQEVKRRPTAVVESVVGDLEKHSLAAHVAHLPGEIAEQFVLAHEIMTRGI